MAYESVWKLRFERLREAGLTFEQAYVVFELLDASHAFGTQTIATSAAKHLDEVYRRSS